MNTPGVCVVTAGQAEQFCRQGQSLLQQGHILQALRCFGAVLETSGYSAAASMGRAVCLLRLGRLLEAEVELAAAARQEPANRILKSALDYTRRFKPSLKGDRDIEWGWSKRMLEEFAKGQFRTARVLDFGCGRTAELTRFAARQGFVVTAVDMMPLEVSLADWPDVRFVCGDFLQQNWLQRAYDLIVNCSSIEHAGLAGRYGVVKDDPDADLRIMKVMSGLIKDTGRMFLVAPVGRDAVVGCLHRVYGSGRLEQLLDGWQIESQCFWIKDENDKWQPADQESALEREGSLAYGIGCLVLRRLAEGLR